MKRTLLLSLSYVLILVGCNDASKNENDLLKKENEILKQEINELKFGADKLFSEAIVLIENKDYYNAETKLQNIIKKHPGTQQSIEAKELLPTVQDRIEEKKISAEKEKQEKEKFEKERLANSTKKLRTKYDDIKDITWYYDKGTPVYSDNNNLHLYMGKSKEGSPWLRFKIQYTSDSWLFIENYTIKTDNQSYTISTSDRKSTRL